MPTQSPCWRQTALQLADLGERLQSAVSSTTGSFDDRREAGSYIAALRQHKLLIIALVVIAVTAAVLYSETAPKRYKATADVLVSPVDGTDTTFLGFSLLRTSSDPDARPVITAARFATSSAVVNRAARALHTSPAAALAAVSIAPLSQGNIVAFTGTASSPTRAAQVANAFAAAFLAQRTSAFHHDLTSTIGRLRSSLAGIPAALRTTSPEALTLQERLGTLVGLQDTNDPTLQLITRAPIPTAASWPRPKLSVIVAFVAALLIGIGIAIALEFVSPRVQREDELLADHRLPILARVPRLPGSLVGANRAMGDLLPADAQESYRTLRASLAHAGNDGGFPKTVLVTSAVPGEGKTMTSVNLAVTLARSGAKVVLVDGDLRRPMIATAFGLALPPRGFTNVLTGNASAADCLVPAPFGQNLALLPASPQHANQIDSLRGERVVKMLGELQERFDVVVIDSPPLTEVADALALADSVEAVIVAVRLGHSRRDRLLELRRVLAMRGVTPVGFVVTTRNASRPGGYYYGFDSPAPTPRIDTKAGAAGATPIDPRRAGQRPGTARKPSNGARPEQPTVAPPNAAAADGARSAGAARSQRKRRA